MLRDVVFLSSAGSRNPSGSALDVWGKVIVRLMFDGDK